MKKINLIGWLSRNSHEKQSPQRFARYAAMLIMLLTIGVGQMWADGGDFYNMYIAYSFEGAGGAIDGDDNNIGVTVDAGTLTSGSLTLTGVYLKCWDDWGSNYKSEGGQLCYTNKGGSIQYVTGLTRSGKSGNNYEYQKSNVGLTIASYNQASGSFSFESWGQTWGSNWGDRYFPKSSGHYTINYKIAPPAVSSYSVSTTGSNILSGSGTSGDPYIIAYNGTLSLSISGSRHHTDGNSSAQYYNTSSSNAWSGTSTKSITSITSTTKTSVTVKMRYYNSTAKIGGTESSTTIYYKSEPSYTVTINNDGNGTTSPSGAQSNIGQSIGVAVSATASTNYEFVNWTITSGSGTFTGGGTTSTSASTRFYPTSAATIRANFRSTLVYSLTVSAGSGVNSVTGSNADVTLNTKYAITATPKTGYTFSSWTASPAANGTFDNASSASTNVTVMNGSVVVTASASERMSTLSTSCSYDVGNPSYAVPTKTASSIGISTQSTIVAHEAGTGYTFAGWTLSSNIVVVSGTPATDHTLIIRTNGDGTEATAQANYTEDLTQSTWVLKGGTAIAGSDNWGTEYALSKKTGHSTEDIVYYTLTNVPVTLDGDQTTYNFKIVQKGASDAYWGLHTDNDASDYWYTRSTGEQTMTSTGGDHNNIQLRADVAGNYEIKVDYTNASEPKITITYPVSYTLTYSIGAVAGTDGSISTSPTTTSGSKVLSENTINLTAPVAKTGYTWKGWYTNAAGTEGKIDDVSRAISVTMDADKTLYACYTEDNYTVTVNASAGGSVASASVTAHKDTKVSLPNATANNGYYFTGWEVTSGTASITGGATDGKINGVSATGVAVRANFAPIWYLKGDFNSWGETHPLTLASSTSGSVTLTTASAKLSNQKFKIWNKQTDTYYQKESQSITRAANTANSGWTEGGTSNDMKFNSDVIGDYTFALTFSSNIPSALTVTYPTAYTVTFGKGTGGSTITASATSAGGLFTSGDYVASGDNVTFTQTASSSGYTFVGWYDAASGGSAVSGMDVSHNVLENVTENKTVWSRYTANNYTVTFDKNGGTTTPSPSSKSVTFGSAYGTLPSGMTHASKTFVGWYTDPADGEGDLITAETIVSNASNHTLYAHYENVYSVTVQFKCGDDVLYPSTTVDASSTSLTPTITAPAISGYRFVNWTGTNVTPASSTSATTTITATASTTITANYEVVPTVYFKNNLGWDSVFVSFDCSFVAGKENVPSNNGKPYYRMTQIGSTDIYYCVIPTPYTTSDYAGWQGNIAFDNTNYGSTGSTTHTGTWSEFYGGECTGRGDFDPKATMYIPYDGDTETRNTCTYYKTGCWIKYNSTESGYQVNMNKLVTGENADTLTVKLTAPVAGSFEFSAKLNLKHANYSYGFKLYKDKLKNNKDLWYTNTGAISAATDDLPWHFWAGSTIDGTTQRCELHTEALGDYTITVSFATGRPEVNVEYPTSVGDWRLAYNDNIAWSSDVHDGSWYLYSRVIKAKTNAEDLVSFYVSKAADANARIELQKCTAINPSTAAETSEKQGDVLDLSDITETGFYNFKVTQNGSKEATAAYDGAYSGNFYIRTDASDGGWTNYKSSKNLMTYSEFSDTNNKGFTHYFMRYVTSGSNIKFCVANDYSECLTEYCVNDDFTYEWIEADGNVRFMWNQNTNAVSRAYISGSTTISDRFLVLEGDAKMFDENGNALTTAGGGKITDLNDYEMKFKDDQNWIYEAMVKAQPKAKVKLTARYNNKVQYFYGDEGTDPEDSVLLIDGTGTDKYKMRIVYDFKTDRLVKAFVPEGLISTDLAINADMMLIREHQGEASQITFGLKNETEFGSLTEVKMVYGAMKFNKWTLNNKYKEEGHAAAGLKASERGLYWISFPFDVKLSEVFGFGTYGTHWIIEQYRGDLRAEQGYWADSEGFWEYIWNRQNVTLEKGKGYVLALDLDLLTESSSIWDNGVEDIYLYFPSTGDVGNVKAINASISVPSHQCNIGPRFEGGDDRRNKDSHWNIIGVPSYANYGEELTNGSSTTITWNNDALTDELPFLYVWRPASNDYTVQSGTKYAFKSMHAYMVQYTGVINWNMASATEVPQSVAARLTNTQDVEYMLSLIKENNEEDHTYVRMTDKEGVTIGFEFKDDLCKEYNSGRANIWTVTADTVQVAGNSQPHPLTTTIVPVGVKIAANGEYTFSMPEGTNGGDVWLIDNANSSRTNLGLMDYTVNLTTGTYEGRFSLEFPVQNVVTDIDNDGMMRSDELNDANDGVRKVFVGGRLYILRDGKAYDATGAQVR